MQAFTPPCDTPWNVSKSDNSNKGVLAGITSKSDQHHIYT